MADPYNGVERRDNEQAWAAFAKQLSVLHADVGDIKSGMVDFKEGMKELSQAILKLALVEERQAHASQAMERSFRLLEKLEQRVDGIALRVTELEKSEPAQSRTAEWVDRAVWAAAAAAVAAAASKLGFFG